jgi:chromosome segregation ATPase
LLVSFGADRSAIAVLSRRVSELEDLLTAAKRATAEVSAERDALAEELRDAHADLAAVGERAVTLQEKGHELAMEAVADERRKWEGVDEEMASLRRQIVESRERYAALEDEQRRSLAALEEARHRMRQYEKRYGLEDAVREVDSLRDELTAVQEELDSVSKRLEDEQSRFMTLTEIARKLAIEGGYPDDVNVFKLFPEHELRLEYATAVDRVKMDNSFLARRVEELEANRVELLRQLRINSQQTGTDS